MIQLSRETTPTKDFEEVDLETANKDWLLAREYVRTEKEIREIEAEVSKHEARKALLSENLQEMTDTVRALAEFAHSNVKVFVVDDLALVVRNNINGLNDIAVVDVQGP